jgi:L-Ala-D/L-Glu epimerase / N-acetyl-D-glutamate racemase
MDVTVQDVSLRLREPLRAAWGTVERRDLLKVTVRDSSGHSGTGEAGPLPGYDEVTLEEVRADLERGSPTLPHARAAIDMARWDLRGRRTGRPLAAVLGGDPLPEVPVNALVSSAEAARAAAEAGFRCVKVKVGLEDDVERVAAIRDAVGLDVAIRVDANGAWSVDEAISALHALSPLDIELCEEPVHGIEGLQAVRAAVDVPVAMDETARVRGAAASGATDAVCLRVGALGGLSATIEAASAARRAGSDVYLASTFDGPVGVAAALHTAAALRVTRPCGLATLALFADLEDPLPPVDGAMRVPARPGLGIGV